jgi:hypothetical protein
MNESLPGMINLQCVAFDELFKKAVRGKAAYIRRKELEYKTNKLGKVRKSRWSFLGITIRKEVLWDEMAIMDSFRGTGKFAPPMYQDSQLGYLQREGQHWFDQARSCFGLGSVSPAVYVNAKIVSELKAWAVEDD